MSDTLRKASSPQQFDLLTTPKIMWGTALALVPSLGYGLYQYGGPAIAVLFTTLVVALLADLLFSVLLDRGSVSDGNAVLLALMLTATFPPATPVLMAATATFFSMAVVKWTFGGTGSYWVNPVAAGYVFSVVSFPDFGTHWILPRTLGGPRELGASALQVAQSAVAESPSRLVEAYHRVAGVTTSLVDDQVTRAINNFGGEFLGVRVPAGYPDLFLGNVAGTIGGASVALLLIGTIFILARTLVSTVIPFAFLLAFSLVIFIFGGVPQGGGLYTGDILFHVTTGATILGAFFIATEPVSSPLTLGGMAIYALLAGGLAAIFRLYGAGVHAVMVAILLVNMVVPLIDRYAMPRRYGHKRRADG